MTSQGTLFKVHENWNLSKLEVYSLKDTVKVKKNQDKLQMETFSKDVSKQKLVFTIYKYPLELNNTWKKTPDFLNDQRI